MRTAALDIGSNSVKLLVVDTTPEGEMTVHFDVARISRLSEGMNASGVLSEVPMQRTLDTIVGLKRDAGLAPDFPLTAMVTAPGRRASNGQAFVDRLASELGIEAEIATEDREAALALLATARAFPDIDPLLVIDLGGASTELAWAVGGESKFSVSVDIGAVRLFEGQLAEVDPIEPAALVRGLAVACDHFAAYADEFDFPEGQARSAVVVSGTATTLASLHLGLDEYDPDRVHGTSLDRQQVITLRDRLAALTIAERRSLKGMDPKRGDVIVAGALIVEALLDTLTLEALVISDRGARWGLLWEALEGKA